MFEYALVYTYTHTYPLFLVPYKTDGDQRGTPPLELTHPIRQGGFGCYDNMRSWYITHKTHVSKQRDGLESLTETL